MKRTLILTLSFLLVMMIKSLVLGTTIYLTWNYLLYNLFNSVPVTFLQSFIIGMFLNLFIK